MNNVQITSLYFAQCLVKIVEQTPEFEQQRDREFILKTAADKLRTFGIPEIKKPEKVYKKLLSMIVIQHDYKPIIKDIAIRNNYDNDKLFAFLGYSKRIKLITAHPARLQVFINCMQD